eukprot:9479948-Pyramimonas_sp.AAC.1
MPSATRPPGRRRRTPAARVQEGPRGDLTSSVDAREPQNPTESEEFFNYQGIFKVCCTEHKGHKRPKR